MNALKSEVSCVRLEFLGMAYNSCSIDRVSLKWLHTISNVLSTFARVLGGPEGYTRLRENICEMAETQE